MSAPIPLAMFVGSWLPYSETFIHDQVRHQARFRAHVVARARCTGAEAFPYEPVLALRRRERLAYVAGRSRRVRATLKQSGARLVHAHFGLNGALALPYAKRAGVPLVVTFHGHDVAGLFPENRYTFRYGWYQLRAPAMLAYASRLLCCSRELADRLCEVGAPPDKIRVHRLGVDLTRFTVPERPARPPTVLMVGRLVDKKGMDDGIRAFARAHRQHPQARLHIVGGGPLRADLEALAGREDAPVTFSGPRDADGVRRAMEGADILMAPSRVAENGDRESGVLVLKEAGATGLPCIGTRHGGIPEIIEDGETGYLVRERDVGALHDRLSALLGDPALRLRLGAAARAKIEAEYDTVRQNHRLEALLAEAL